MLTKTCAVTGLVTAAVGGVLLMGSLAGATDVNENQIDNSNTSTSENVNTNVVKTVPPVVDDVENG
jgi:hypothetical protein